jgi:hypothetical protein
VGDLSWWWVKWIGDGSLSHDVAFQKKGWLGAVWFNSSDIVCDSAMDLNLLYRTLWDDSHPL